MSARKELTLFIIFLIACWAAVELLIQPWGNFPLNDDWIYAVSVRSLVTGGNFILTGWNLNTSLFHILAGSLVCSLLGFSFETLRLTSLVCGAITLVCTWQLLSQIQAGPKIKAFAVVLIATNPLFFYLSNVFMTDVCGLALAVLALLFYISFWRAGNGASWAAAVVSTIASTLTRQAALALPIAFPIGHLIFGERSRRTMLWATLPLLLTGAALVAYELAIKNAFGEFYCNAVERQYVASLFEDGLFGLVYDAAGTFLRASLYLGGMMLPLCLFISPPVLASLKKDRRIFLALLIAEVALISGALLLWNGNLMPLADNIIHKTGLGPAILPATDQSAWRPLPEPIWVAVTLLCALGASLLWAYLALFVRRIYLLARAGEADPDDKAAALCMLIFFVYTAGLVGHGFFDRYLTFCLPFLCVVLGRLSLQRPPQASIPQLPFSIAAALLVVFQAFYSIAGTHDYFEWNRARWRALDTLSAARIPSDKIDGGMEFNYWSVYKSGSPAPPVSVNPYPSIDQRWLITTGPRAGYQIDSTWSFQPWLLPGNEHIFILRRLDVPK